MEIANLKSEAPGLAQDSHELIKKISDLEAKAAGLENTIQGQTVSVAEGKEIEINISVKENEKSHLEAETDKVDRLYLASLSESKTISSELDVRWNEILAILERQLAIDIKLDKNFSEIMGFDARTSAWENQISKNVPDKCKAMKNLISNLNQRTFDIQRSKGTLGYEIKQLADQRSDLAKKKSGQEALLAKFEKTKNLAGLQVLGTTDEFQKRTDALQSQLETNKNS
jgi:predicted  nucleic acid-binding Zn-ribbon protein